MNTTEKTDDTRIPCVAYCAKSSQEDSRKSVTQQIDSIRAAIEREGNRYVVTEKYDEARSGYKTSQKDGLRGDGLAEAREVCERLAKDHETVELWVYHTNRLARGDAKQASHLIEHHIWAERNGVTLRAVDDDALLRMGMIGTAIAGDGNNKYSKDLSAAVKRGIDAKFAEGKVLGGPAPDGLRREVRRENDKVISRHYYRDPDRAPIIEEIFAMAEANLGDTAIAQALNRKGYRTAPREGEPDGIPWYRRRIQDTITNPIYAGWVTRFRGTDNEQRVKGTNVDALLDPDRYDVIIAKRRQRDRVELAGASHKRKTGRTATRFFLSNLATCNRCGSRMFCQTSTHVRKDGTKARFYLCKNVHGETGMCNAPKVCAEAVDAALVPHIKSFFSDYGKWAEAIRDENSREREILSDELASIEKRLATLRRAEPGAQERYTEALADGDDIRAEATESALRRIVTDRKKLDTRAAEVNAILEALAVQAAPSDSMISYWRGVAETIRGRFDAAESVEAINAELVAALIRVDLDTVPTETGDTFVITPYLREGAAPGAFQAHAGRNPIMAPLDENTWHDGIREWVGTADGAGLRPSDLSGGLDGPGEGLWPVDRPLTIPPDWDAHTAPEDALTGSRKDTQE